VLNVSTTSLSVPQTFITQQTQASFTIWNGAGGKLTGTVSVPAPFSIVSGGSFSLSPGQPQEVTVKFTSTTAGSFSKSVSISSTGGSKTVTATSVAHKVSFAPAQVDFGSGLLVMTEQCNDMGVCGLRTEKVGLPVEKQLTVKNEGTASVTLTLSTAAPYKVVSVLPTLSPGQSGQVTVRFEPSESGSFTGNVQIGINGGQGSLTSGPLNGVAHKIEVSPPQIGFGLILLSDDPENNSPAYKEQQLTVKNQGVTTVSLTVSTSEPFSVVSRNSFTLAAAENQEVTVRFDAPAPGRFEGSVRLAVGQLNVEIPAQASVMNEQDFLQLLADVSQEQELNTTVDDVGLLGFRNLTPEDIQALLQLAKTQDWGSLSPDQTDNWIIDQLIGLLFGLALDLLSAGDFNITGVLVALDLLAQTLRLTPNNFLSNFESFYEQDSNFRRFVDGLESVLRRSDPRVIQAFGGGTARDAAQAIIRRFAEVLNSAPDEATAQKMRNMVTNLGPAGLFGIVGLSYLDPSRTSGVLEFVVNTFNELLAYLAGKDWWGIDKPLWRQLVNALAVLGSLHIDPNNAAIQKAFKETLIALGVVDGMLDEGGWNIYGFRVKLPVLSFTQGPALVDVVAATNISTSTISKRVIVFAQFFHAVTGLDTHQLESLVTFVIQYARSDTYFRAQQLEGLFGLGWGTAVHEAQLAQPTIIVAVNRGDEGKAIGIIEDGQARCNNCFGGVVIVVNPTTHTVEDILGVGISHEEAKKIAERMGIRIGDIFSVMMLLILLGLIR
jgi:hypothetical protein